ncbi:MAG: hypothetical protein AAF330_02600 [Pseudomonadota bacterium]
MKKLVLAAAFAGAASFAHAGGMSAPIMEPMVMVETVEESASTSGGILLPLLLVVLLAAAAG